VKMNPIKFRIYIIVRTHILSIMQNRYNKIVKCVSQSLADRWLEFLLSNQEVPGWILDPKGSYSGGIPQSLYIRTERAL
jgi:hypothetical protein